MSANTANQWMCRVALGITIISWSVACAPIAAVAKQGNSAPVELSFDKSAIAEGVWKGTVSGDIEGDLKTELTNLRVTGSIWHVDFDWIIVAGDKSLTAELSGILNLNTGRVVMNGTVVEGHLNGAQVHEEGQLIDPATLRFMGTIRIMPATSK